MRMILNIEKHRRLENSMADFVILLILGAIVILIIRGQLRRAGRPQDGGGCSGCAGCSACGGHSACAGGTDQKTEKAGRK